MKIQKVWEKDGYVIRPAQKTDAANYFDQNYNPLDKTLAYFTGCKEVFTKEEVLSFFLNSIEDDTRYFFLIISPDKRIIGESMINEINWELRSANFRIGIYHDTDRGKGLGTWATEAARDFAFEELKLHRLSLDVFSFNQQAERIYKKAGFHREGVLRDAIADGERYADDILMAILEDDWRKIKSII